LILRVDSTSAVPPYEQIRAQIAKMIDAGVLPMDHRLPTIRQLASDLGLAGGTVARAYRELEHDGYIAPRGRHGTFVADRLATSRKDREQAVIEAASAFALQAAHLGVDPRRALDRALQTLGSSAVGGRP